MRKSLIIFFCMLLHLTVLSQVKVQLSRQTTTKGDQTYWVHTVKRGETIEAIAKAYQVSLKDIIAQNPGARYGVKPRQVIMVPVEKSADQEQSPHDESTQKTASTEKSNTDPLARPDSTTRLKSEDVQSKNGTTTRDGDLGRETTSGKDNGNGISTQDAASAKNDTPTRDTTKPGTRLIHRFDKRSPINVALLLPLSASSGNNQNFVDFYQGTLIALDSLKSRGVSVNLKLLSTENSAKRTNEIVESDALKDANLIIGPVYGSLFDIVAEYAIEHRIPIVSPLLAIKNNDSPFVFQAAPADSTKYSKIATLLSNAEANYVMLRPLSQPDVEMLDAITEMLPHSAKVIDYEKGTSSTLIINNLDKDRENIIIVPMEEQSAVEEALARLTSLNSMGRYRITVIGSAKWNRFNNIDVGLFFKLNVHHVTSYHADRQSHAVANFYARYYTTFGSLPSLFTFRGYDVMMWFTQALSTYGEKTLSHIEQFNTPLLQTKYRYEQSSTDSKYSNSEWVLLNYTPSYDIVAR